MNEPQALSAEDVARVRASFDRLWPRSSEMTELFYRRLFDVTPEVRTLFHDDMTEQRRKFIGTLATIVGNLDTAVATSVATTLARHHVAYGVRPDHYPLVGEALLFSLAQTLGDQLSSEEAASWSRAYAMISDHMVRTAYS